MSPNPMTIDEMYARWGDPTPVSFEEVERQIQEARDAYADELALEDAESETHGHKCRDFLNPESHNP
jgi:hypothetical protein